MAKKQSKHSNKLRTAKERHTIRRRSRVPMLIITGLTALASLALVVAGFLSYTPPR